MAIVRNIQNNQLYRYLGDNKFRNIVSGQEGLVEDEKAIEVFKINVECTWVISEYPLVEELIEVLKLKIDKQ